MVKRSKTSPFHGGNSGSSPDGGTKCEQIRTLLFGFVFYVIAEFRILYIFKGDFLLDFFVVAGDNCVIVKEIDCVHKPVNERPPAFLRGQI